MTRGDLARGAGVGPETIRYYERIGLLEDPPRTAAGYRVYGSDDLSRLRFIRWAKELGFSLEEVRELITLRLDGDSDCSEVEHRASRRLADVRVRIQHLERIRSALEELVASCRANPAKEACPVLEMLEGER